ncbi:MAG: hypothetical protein JSR91_01600 [Proteobacteria bacterium]|nr:hypothetical protein [Pseudomonadota bacterium]
MDSADRERFLVLGEQRRGQKAEAKAAKGASRLLKRVLSHAPGQYRFKGSAEAACWIQDCADPDAIARHVAVPDFFDSRLVDVTPDGRRTSP